MQIILTHEQADFDGLASLLGVFLLNDEAFPILPRRLNRDVRAFLTLYSAQLPFIEPRDLPADTIEAATLVDTQSLITMKGMTRHTRVQIIDHHQKRSNLSADWVVKTDRVGACATLLVEELRERDMALNMIQATLLLLGIYEDTGSLTYASTTPRDLYAAAFLLERGASLHITSEYLNVPLSIEQRQLYDRLLAAIEHHSIHRQNIVIARADAQGLTEEISSVAHKLRDIMELDALFILVSAPDGVYMVARSTTDRINVSDIVANFGGGGHERAASALIRPKSDADEGSRADPEKYSIDGIYRELLNILPNYITPSVSVGQIMSRQPLLLNSQITAQEASGLMQRYGYEGFPVVTDNKVIGLLTRRAVDRAISHKLNLTASSLMEAGEVVVYPNDSLEHLQRIMTSSGWGQVPVIDPDNRMVIGIVTRTDLLKALTSAETTSSEKQKLDSRLEAALPPSRLSLLKLIAAQAHDQHLGVYIVGGFVRDLLLDCPDLDFDIVVEGDAIALGRALANIYGGRVVAHSRFGTAKWWIRDAHNPVNPKMVEAISGNTADLPQSVDLISARTEFYEYPTALPTVKSSSIKLDLHRRDFTINTLALRLDGNHYGELFDYWGGLSDLRAGLVRVLHSLSFIDDPTRLLRAVRFEQRFNFRIEERTCQLMDEAYPLLHQVSGERLQHELNMIIKEEHPVPIFIRLQKLGILSAIHPDLGLDDSSSSPLETILKGPLDPEWNLPNHVGNLPLQLALGYLVWLGKLPVETVLDIAARLHLSGGLKDALKATSALWKDLMAWDNPVPSQVAVRLETVPIVSLYAVYCLDLSESTRQLISQFIHQWRYIKPITNGDDLRKRQIKPGPAYHVILDQLRSAWLDGEIKTEVGEQALMEEILQNLPGLEMISRDDQQQNH